MQRVAFSIFYLKNLDQVMLLVDYTLEREGENCDTEKVNILCKITSLCYLFYFYFLVSFKIKACSCCCCCFFNLGRRFNLPFYITILLLFKKKE